jgi:hypothetical protein
MDQPKDIILFTVLDHSVRFKCIDFNQEVAHIFCFKNAKMDCYHFCFTCAYTWNKSMIYTA